LAIVLVAPEGFLKHGIDDEIRVALNELRVVIEQSADGFFYVYLARDDGRGFLNDRHWLSPVRRLNRRGVVNAKSYECEVATHIGPESCGAAGSVEGVVCKHDSYSDSDLWLLFLAVGNYRHRTGTTPETLWAPRSAKSGPLRPVFVVFPPPLLNFGLRISVSVRQLQ
jgi:hypothetical protein